MLDIKELCDIFYSIVQCEGKVKIVVFLRDSVVGANRKAKILNPPSSI